MNAAVGRGCSRWVVYFGAAGVLILVVFLFATARFMERSLVSLALRARQRVLEPSSPGSPPGGAGADRTQSRAARGPPDPGGSRSSPRRVPRPGHHRPRGPAPDRCRGRADQPRPRWALVRRRSGAEPLAVGLGPALRRSSVTRRFSLQAPFSPAGDQPEAVARLLRALEDGVAYQTLLGVTGSGKTYTMAQVIAAIDRPTLVLSHNKTLAAQLYQEFRASSRPMRSSTSSRTTTTTSRRLTSRRVTPTSRRRPRSTRKSTASGCRRPDPCSNAGT